MIEQLDNYNEILFGPFLGELGWETTRWAGFVRWYKSQNPQKKIIVATRADRVDLYTNCVDHIHSLNLGHNDYNKYRPNMYRLDFFPKEQKDKLIQNLSVKYPNAFIFEPPNTNNRSVFDIETMDLNFQPRKDNEIIIQRILQKNKNKYPIVISSRHRIDMTDAKRVRNWKLEYWNELYTRLSNSNEYIVFVTGKSPSYVIPDKTLKNIYCLESFLSNQFINISLIGLTISAIKNSLLTIGQQSSIPVLSNYLKTATIMWGDERHRHKNLENPYDITCYFFEEGTSEYKTTPQKIHNQILQYCTKEKPFDFTGHSFRLDEDDYFPGLI